MQMVFEGETSGNYKVKLIGEFDAQGCREIREPLEDIVDKCGDKLLRIDMSEVTFLDSSGVGAIVFLFKRISSAGGNLSLINLHGQPQELIFLLRVHEAITVETASDSRKMA